MNELIAIQEELKVLKANSNKDIKFKYRTCEEIFQAVKPICFKLGVLLTVTDEVISVGDRIYIKATATVRKKNTFDTVDGYNMTPNPETCISASGWAREPEKLMSMSYPQITGSCSSYARKTAMGGLFAIDNNEDPDSGAGVDDFEPKVTVDQLKEFDDFYDMSETKVKAWIDKYKKDDMLRKDAESMLKILRENK